MSPRWYIQNFDQRGARMIHLSYHDEEHYNSLRSKEDLCDGPARPIVIKADATLSQVKAASSKSNGLVLGNKADSGSVKVVMAGSGCENIEKVEQVLLQVHGDVDAAIEYLIAERESENYSIDNGSLPCQAHSFSENLGDDVDGRCDQSLEELSNKTRKHEHLIVLSKKALKILAQRQMIRRYQETRSVHVDLKRSTSLVVEWLRGDPLL
ncbi:unnamed protein product [Linum trigynum]|uniref:UBA domain-containing protein n=1 Tax=Linum trigynum TaxID=586398 RepID=A0AAV2DG84_9ROSI